MWRVEGALTGQDEGKGQVGEDMDRQVEDWEEGSGGEDVCGKQRQLHRRDISSNDGR